MRVLNPYTHLVAAQAARGHDLAQLLGGSRPDAERVAVVVIPQRPLQLGHLRDGFVQRLYRQRSCSACRAGLFVPVHAPYAA